jgi:hypothetical protein
MSGARAWTVRPLAMAALLAFCFLPAHSRVPAAKDENAYERGVPFVTDGEFPGGPCFRVAGRMTAENFFAGLKRVNTRDGVQFRRGKEILTTFPDEVLVQVQIRDLLCPDFVPGEGRKYLTPDEMKSLVMAFYWKRGFSLRKAEKVTPVNAFTQKIPRPAWLQDPDANLPDRYVWNFEVSVGAAGVPLTDHLVLVIRENDGKIVARVSARM